MAERKFDDKEVGEILKKAAEMQSGLTQSGGTGGITLTELQKVAEEIGIRPDVIDRAADEIDASPKGQSQSKSNSVLLERTVSGELSDETWEEIITEMRRYTGSPGRTGAKGLSREWVGGSDTITYMLSASRRGGRTRLKVLGDMSGVSALTITCGIVIGIFVSLVPLICAAKYNFVINPFITATLMALMAGLCVSVTSGVVRSTRKAFSNRIEELSTKLVAIAEAHRVSTRTELPNNSIETIDQLSVRLSSSD